MSEPALVSSWGISPEQVWTGLNRDDQLKVIQLMAQLAFNLMVSKELDDANKVTGKQNTN